MDSSVSRIETELGHRYEGKEVEIIADGVAGLWREIDAVLRPIIGQRGVAALYQRSLHLSSQTYPWLAGAQLGTPLAIDLTQLKTQLVQQQGVDLIKGGALLFTTFHELLVSLVGPSLTERLLRSVGSHFFSGAAAAQDCS